MDSKINIQIAVQEPNVNEKEEKVEDTKQNAKQQQQNDDNDNNSLYTSFPPKREKKSPQTQKTPRDELFGSLKIPIRGGIKELEPPKQNRRSMSIGNAKDTNDSSESENSEIDVMQKLKKSEASKTIENLRDSQEMSLLHVNNNNNTNATSQNDDNNSSSKAGNIFSKIVKISTPGLPRRIGHRRGKSATNETVASIVKTPTTPQQPKESENVCFREDLDVFYDQQVQAVEEEYQTQIDELESQLKKIKEEMNDKIEQINATRRKVLDEFDNFGKIEIPSTSSSLPTKLCKTQYLILSDLISKLKVTSCIKPGELFAPIDELYQLNPNEKMNNILSIGHFGYEVNRHMMEYSKKMKVIYCAVNHSFNEKTLMNSYAPMYKQMKFTASAAYHMMANKVTADAYGDLRKHLDDEHDVEFVRNVWDLLEDPVTSFFATSLGFAPSMEKMKTDKELRIPVPFQWVFPGNDLTQSSNENSPELSSSASSTSSTSSKQQQKRPSVDLCSSSSSASKSYFIRCRYISPFTHNVDNSLLVNQNLDRTNFEEGTVKLKKSGLLSTGFGSIRAPKFSLSNSSKEYKSNLIIIHIHGGGWVSQSPDQHLPYLSEWAKVSETPAISIDYSLSPERQYPVCVNECFAIYKWLQNAENCRKMGLPVCKLKKNL